METEEKTQTRCQRFTTVLTVLSFCAVTAAVIAIVLTRPEKDGRRSPLKAVWRYECIGGKCEQILIEADAEASARSMAECKLLCNDYGNIWPKPTGIFNMTKTTEQINIKDVNVRQFKTSGPAVGLVTSAITRFKSHLENIPPADIRLSTGGRTFMVTIDIKDTDVTDLKLDTDESYSLQIYRSADTLLKADVSAPNFFGARHALETLIQLIVYDDIHSKVIMPITLQITDRPVYAYRGLSLDTSRNFFSVDSIKRTLDAMGSSKLNRFHWHITDSHSFAFESKSRPELTRLGAMTPSHTYSIQDIRSVVRYGIERGVKIVPEFDAPAHVGAGWQNTNYVVCYKREPWAAYCYEPPCGQFNPTIDGLYDALEDIYRDMFDLFKPDIFHMGGDEVLFPCWNETSITDWMSERSWDSDTAGFINLWGYFQEKAFGRLVKANNNNKVPVVLWTSGLSDPLHIEDHLKNEDYIIQVWEDEKHVVDLLEKNYRLIISNVDAMYLDCGFGAWVGGEPNNWCSPYKSWQTIYKNDITKMGGAKKDLILGAEVALWAEQADDSNLDSRLWPRAAALGERLWADPSTSWEKAEWRLLQFRKRLVKMGINADAMQPEWCHHNEGYCFLPD